MRTSSHISLEVYDLTLAVTYSKLLLVLNTHNPMATSLDYNTEQRIDKALKQLPYKQSKNDFIVTAIDNYLKDLLKKRVIHQKI